MSAIATETPIIAMRGVTVATLKSSEATVARSVDWTVQAGEFWVVAAPQYTGKSDFLMTIGGIIAPRAGDYSFLGEPMPIFEEPRLSHRLRMGFVFDGGQLLNQLTIAENIALPLRYHKKLGAAEIEARVGALLELTELTEWAHNTPANVGRSWRQRAGLARALATAPEVLLLDSPLTGLDVRHTIWWLRLLDGLAQGHEIVGRKPITLIATADDLRPWRRHANRVACLSRKRFLVVGDWVAVDASDEPVVKELLRD